jgi:transposase
VGTSSSAQERFSQDRWTCYGTILVDLEQHRVVDLLPDRGGSTLAVWLTNHPGVEVVSRDRGGEYADGARRGAPAAVQVADRFHLVRNLGEVVLRVLRRRADLVGRVPAPAVSDAPAPPTRADHDGSRARTARETEALFAAVQDLAGRGMNNSAIARALGVHRHTVQKYRPLAAAPERRHLRRRPSIVAPHHRYLLERWRQGCRSARALWKEIAARGYPGGYREVARFVAELKRRERAGEPLVGPPRGLLPRQALGLLLARSDRRTAEERVAVERLLAQHPDIGRSAALLDGFARLLRERTDEPAAERLARWEADATGAGLPEVDGFVTKLRQDRDAVLGALTLPWSQGQTEGQVNRLKSIKRAMYGRAGFDLLRQRVLHGAA